LACRPEGRRYTLDRDLTTNLTKHHRAASTATGFVAGLLVALAFAACGGGGGGSSPPPAQNPTPVLTSITPTSAGAGGPAFTLTVTGSRFISSSKVHWNGSDHTTTFVSANKLTASILASDIAASGTASVTAFNPSPGGGTSGGKNFSILNGVPVQGFLSPSVTPAGTPEFTLTVNGSGFVSGSTVLWNGSPRTTTFISSTRLDALILSSDVASTGSRPVTVENPPPGGGTTALLTFTIVAAPTGRNDTCADAQPIPNGRIRASISPYGDVDVYSFHGTVGHQVTIEIFAARLDLDGDPTNRDSYLDSVLELLDDTCPDPVLNGTNALAFNDDINPGVVQDSLIRVSSDPFPSTTDSGGKRPPTALPYTGTYFIRVRDFRGDGRPDLVYDLSLSGAD